MLLRSIACTLLLATASLSATAAQMGDMKADSGKKLPSPPATAKATVGSATIQINYNAPSVRGRKIFGGLVPYGQVWRTGANPATTIITSEVLRIGTLALPAGTHTSTPCQVSRSGC